MEMRYTSLSDELKREYGTKVYKIALDAGCTCPNRDGTLDTRGCIFCSEGGSGEFASDRNLSINEQIEQGKNRLSRKIRDGKYIAYFQSFTNTYGPIETLEKRFFEAADHPDIAVISIATRPDCLPDEVLDLLTRLKRVKPVWVELGLQSIHAETAEFIRRGFDLKCFEEAVEKLSILGIPVIVHLILGLPGETREMILQSVDYVGTQKVSGVKLSMLHILENTDLAALFRKGNISLMSREEYLGLLCDCVNRLPQNIVIHRLTGDGPKKILVAPQWSGNKRQMINDIRRVFKEKDVCQGSAYVQ